MISDEWLRITGSRYSALQVRYARVKAAIARVKDEHIEVLMNAIRNADERIEVEKRAMENKRWDFVAEHMESNGAYGYDTATLERTYKRVQANFRNGGT